MQAHTTNKVRLAAAGAVAALGVIATAIPGAAAGDVRGSSGIDTPSTATGTLPGDAPVPFWPHETGALAGTGETYVDVRADGSYYDPGVGRRVSLSR